MISLKTFLALLLPSYLEGKDHFIMKSEHAPVRGEHAMVRATGKTCRLCFFDDTLDTVNESNNEFCLTMSGSMRWGVEWKQDAAPLNKVTKTGHAALYMNIFSK